MTDTDRAAARARGQAIRGVRVARARRIRRRVTAGALALFIAAWLMIAIVLVSGHDPALAKHSSAATVTSSTSPTVTTRTSGSSSSSSPSTSSTSTGSGSSGASTSGTSSSGTSSGTSSGSGGSSSGGVSSVTTSQS